MTQIQNFTAGTKVQGLYHDTPYRGVVVEARVDTAANKYLLTVELDAEITCYGKTRSRIHFSENDFVTVGSA